MPSFTHAHFIQLLYILTATKPPKGLQFRPFGKFHADGQTLSLVVNRYAYVGAPIAIHVVSESCEGSSVWYEPWCDLTKSLRGISLPDGEVHIKTYEENAPLRDVLLNSTFFEDTGRRTESGFVHLEVWRLTDAFYLAFASAHPAELKHLSRVSVPA